MARKVAGKVFEELQLLEYYEDLKDHDQSIWSVCKGLQYPILDDSGESGPSVKKSFLEKFEDKKNAKKNILSWNLNSITEDTITKEVFVNLFLQYNEEHMDGAENADEDNYNERIKRAEENWCIRQGVVDEWGPVFDRFLQLYNVQDINTILNAFRNNDDHSNKENRLSLDELKNWMYPKFQPPTWKKVLFPDEYKKQEKINQIEFQALFRSISKSDGPTNKVEKAEFIERIMEELRDGDQKVR